MKVFGDHNIFLSVALLFIALSSLAINADAEGLSSANFRIDVDMIDAGGDYSYSLNYDLSDSIGQSSAIGPSSGTTHHIYGGFWYALMGIGNKYGISGSGYNYPEPGYRAGMSLNILQSSLGTGWLNYYYSRLKINFISTSITAITVVGNTVTITGEGTVNGAPGYRFTAIITDGNYDTMGITIYNQDGTVYFQSNLSLISNGDFRIDIPVICVNPPVSITGSTPLFSSTLQTAYDTAVDGETVQIRNIALTENLIMDRNISLTIQGGVDCNYASNAGRSTLNGSLIISNGIVTMSNIVLQ